MVTSFVVWLDIPATLNILYEMIKIMYEKMLNLIYLYWFHIDASDESNSQNVHSNEPWINW